MTHLLSIDPGLNTGIALGYYDDTTPYTLLERWQVHYGVPGFLGWWDDGGAQGADELVVESFVLDPRNQFTADLTPKEIEGVLAALLWKSPLKIQWQSRTTKSGLIGYSEKAKKGTKANRQRERFDFLKHHGLFAPGEDNTDSNDAIVHALVNLKGKHRPTLEHYWPRKAEALMEPISSQQPLVTNLGF